MEEKSSGIILIKNRQAEVLGKLYNSPITDEKELLRVATKELERLREEEK